MKNRVKLSFKWRIHILLLALAAAFTSAHAYDFKADGICYTVLGDESSVLVVYDPMRHYAGDITIPASVTHDGVTYTVSGIGGMAFFYDTELTGVSIPRTVTSIDGDAFYGCQNLVSITVEEGNPVYDSRGGCNALIESATGTLLQGCKGTVIPSGVTAIGDEAFHYCTTLTDVDIPSTVTSIGVSAFEGTGLKDIKIPASVTTLGDYAFFGCHDLEAVTLGSGVKTIGMNSFVACTSLASIQVDGGNPVFDSREGCNAVIETATGTLRLGCKSTVIPNTVSAIGNYAFYFIHGLKTIDIPNSVISIGEGAFYYCPHLTTMTIGDGVTDISDKAFYNCSALMDISFGKSVKNLGKDMLAFCSLLGTITVSGDNPYYDAREGCNALVESATNTLIVGCKGSFIPKTVTAIGDRAFYHCSSLTDISIPNTLLTIGNEAFAECRSLSSLTFEEPSSPGGNGILTIGNKAFESCSSLTEVTVGNTVKEIGDEAFSSCSKLQNIVLGNPSEVCENPFMVIKNAFDDPHDSCAVTLGSAVKEIEDYTFNSYRSVTSLTIGVGNRAMLMMSNIGRVFNNNKLTKIVVMDGNTYYDSRNDCNALIETPTNTLLLGCPLTIIPNSVTAIGDFAFSNCKDLTTINIPNSVTAIGDHAFSDCTGLTTVNIPNSVTDIGDAAFSNCKGLTAVNIPESVTAIGDAAFSDCTGLTAVNIPDSVTTIGRYAFYNTRITSIDIPYSVTTIGNWAFDQCIDLTDLSYNAKNIEYLTGFGNQIERVTIGPKVEKLPQNFLNNSKITEVTIPNSVTIISFNAFKDCKGLTTVKFPDTLNRIEGSAFSGCTGLTNIKFPDSLNSLWVGQSAFSGCTGLTSLEFPDSTSIVHYAFEGCTGLTSVTFRCTTYSWLGQEPFKGCTNLMSVTCTGTKPPQCPYDWSCDAFSSETYQEGALFVPEEALGKYREANGWRKFANIKPIALYNCDVTGDGLVNIADVNSEIGTIFSSEMDVMKDVNGDGKINITDVNAIINHILSSH